MIIDIQLRKSQSENALTAKKRFVITLPKPSQHTYPSN
jgi:hypothetical protein